MASSVQRGIQFSLTVGLSTFPKCTILQKERKLIFDYIETQLPLYRKHLRNVEKIDFFDVVSFEIDSDNRIQLKVSVNNEDSLSRFYDYARNKHKEEHKSLSKSLTNFFYDQSLQFRCGFKLEIKKINFSVQMSDKERKKVAAEFKKDAGKDSANRKPGHSRNDNPHTSEKGSSKVKSAIKQFEGGNGEQRNTAQDGSQQGISILMTFLIDVPAGKEVISAKIRCRSVEAVNREMFWTGGNIYSVDIAVPSNYDPFAYYCYEITFKDSVLYFFERTSKVTSNQFTLGNKTVHRDIIWEVDGMVSHLIDIVMSASKKYSESDLCMQIEDICKHTPYYDVEHIIKALLDTGIVHYQNYLCRFAFLLGVLCKGSLSFIYKTIEPTNAQKILDALMKKRLEDFPTSCQDYMIPLCKHLLKRGYEQNFCVLIFLDRASFFLPEDMLLLALKDCISNRDKFINETTDCQKLANKLCWSFYNQYIQTGSLAFKDIVDYLFRHLPLEWTLSSYGSITDLSEYEDNTSMERKEEVLMAITASIKSQIHHVSNSMMKEKAVLPLMKIATTLGAFGRINDKSIQTIFEERVVTCFSWHSLKETVLTKDVENFLRYSNCFNEIETQLLLLKSISESRNAAVRRLFIELNKGQLLTEAYDSLEVDVYKTLLQNEIKISSTRNEDEILITFRKLCEIIKLPIVLKRKDVRTALESVTMESLKRFTLKEMLQIVEKIDSVCEAEPTVSFLYKEQVLEHFKKKGWTPTDMLIHFCTNGKLRVNTKTTCDIVCTIIDLCFEKYAKDKTFDSFINHIKHVAFWELVVDGQGSRIHDVKSSMTYKQVLLCIKENAFLLKNNELDISFLSKISLTDEKTKRTLQLGGMQKKDIEAMQTNMQNIIKKVMKTTSCIHEVLKEVQIRMNDSTIPDISGLLDYTESLKARLECGSLSFKECASVGWLWGDLRDLPEICTSLHSSIKSDVFWNVTKTTVLTCYETDTMQEEMPCGALISIRYLFDAETSEDCGQDIEISEQAICFLKILQKMGIDLFEESWTTLENDNTISMQSVQKMFLGANVPQEITMAENFLKRDINGTVKETLLQLSRKEEVREKAEAMKLVLQAFGYEISEDLEVHVAFESFHELIQQTLSDYTLEQVQKALHTIFVLAEHVTDETVDIMAEIGKSSLLLEFLKEIANEDVRNLIDAVEDISESHVQESTVSALIETKRFLLPLLTSTDIQKKGSRWIFQTLQKQTVAYGKSAGSIPGKISDCSLNLHNLKSLYNNVANRGQQTKEIIKSIITKGRFSFMLCTDQDRVMFEVTYKENKNKFTKQEVTLSDIRSRALLLLNSERQCAESSFNQEEFRLFIESVDLCLEIRSILNELFSSGHIRYKSLKLGLSLGELKETKDQLRNELDEWINHLRHSRNKYYLMNFVQGCQIRVISDFLEKGIDEDEVGAILKYIHPSLSVEALISEYRKDTCLSQEDVMLEELGRSLHKVYANRKLFVRDMKSADFTSKITECVYKGKILVAKLDENSEFVTRTILALYRNTTHHFPEPNQLLICTRTTSWNEIDLLLQRCKGSYSFYGSMPLYCLANVELLQNEVQFRLVEELQSIREDLSFLLAIVCRGSKNHPFVDQLNDRVVTVQPVSNHGIENLFSHHHSQVVTYTSEVAGLGKTSKIYEKSVSASLSTVTLHISGHVRKERLIANLKDLKVRNFHTLHFDIGVVDNPDELDIFLFQLVVMKFVALGKLAFYMPTEYVCFEIGNTINNTLRNNLTTITSFQRVHLLWNDFSDFVCSQEINSPVQVVCHYLMALDRGVLDTEDLCFTGKMQLKPLLEPKCRALLRNTINITADISFSVVNVFLNVLSDQLKKLSYSAFFKVSRISEMIGQLGAVPTVRSSLVKAMIDVSIEFASRSVNACRSTQSSTLGINKTPDECERKAGDLVDKIIHRVDGMIRWEESNHLIYVFHNQNINTLSPMYRNKDKVPDHIQKLFESQMKRKLSDFSTMEQVELQNILQRVARTNPTALSTQQLDALSRNYALTPDNLLKMVLIMMRIQSNVPVLIMGETGCGKTSLIRYLACICEVPFRVLNVHAGVSTEEIIQIVMQENCECLEKVDVQRWLFLDEINTSENIGLICDIICHHRCIGSVLSPNMVIMGACNPYKLRTVEAIHTAGLTSKVKTDELSKLVYRVLPLPEMIVDYVWDFGSLSDIDELKYIQRMVESVFANGTMEHALFSDLLSISQTFVRETELSTSVVSLRDVQRCKILVPWFKDILKKKGLETDIPQLTTNVTAIILSLAHCYHSRFMKKSVRKAYREQLIEGFKRKKITWLAKETDINDIIKKEQKNILERMDLPHGTAKNTALQENVFVILVCILNKIPIFVVGKPGCSKSLAMQVIRSNLRGKDSKDPLFKKLPQLYCVSFQGSESSTSDGIIKVFEKAENYQNSNSKDSVLSVVILDEIGLAEISRFNPLKVLHNLLEPEGRSLPNVAVVGISNWALDASKMNRAVHLSRPDMDEEELFETAKAISNSFIENTQGQEDLFWNDKTTTRSLEIADIEPELLLVAKSYTTYTNKLQHKNFHGLRDFYSLVKFIARNLAEDTKNLTSQKKSAVIIEGLLRNFGGLKLGRQSLFDNFRDCFQTTTSVSPSSVQLIGSNIGDEIARHLMIITKGESVLGILERNLRESGRDRNEIIFGSQFEEDLTDDYNYRILSRIILCMEQGIVLVLKDLENIYGSLYDMLNQNYTRIGKKNNCRVALGPYSNPFCHVAASFRCIVLVDENKVDYTDPPFLNRFEKQFLTFADVITDNESKLVDELENWMESLTAIEGKPFSKYNAVPYYNEELIISLVLFLKGENIELENSFLQECKNELLWILKPEVIVRLSHADDIVVQQSSEQVRNTYFQLPLHNGLGHLIQYQTNDEIQSLTIVFTKSNIHTNLFSELKNWRCQSEKLGAFKSEKQLSIKLQQFWNNPGLQILLVHCSAQDDDKHIMLTKSLIEKYRAEHLELAHGTYTKKVYLIIHLAPRDLSDPSDLSLNAMSQLNYLSGWKLLLLENLECPKVPLPVVCSKSLLETIEEMLPLIVCLKEELFWAFTRIQYEAHGRDVESIKNVIEKAKNSDDFFQSLGEMIWSYLGDTCNGVQSSTEWFVHVACDTQALNTSAFLIDALERHIRTIIKIPLAKIVYKLEFMGAMDSYFIVDANTTKRRDLWYTHIKNENIFSFFIKDKPIKDPTGPECYQCDTADLCLKLPFSRFIFETIEETKDLFTDEVSRAKVKCDLDGDDSLPDEILDEIIMQQESYVLKKLSDLLESSDAFGFLADDYVEDYSNLFSYTLSSLHDQDTRIENMKWIIQQKVKLDFSDTIQLLTRIHCAGWLYVSTYGSLFQLLELCSNVFNGENILLQFQQDYITDESVTDDEGNYPKEEPLIAIESDEEKCNDVSMDKIEDEVQTERFFADINVSVEDNSKETCSEGSEEEYTFTECKNTHEVKIMEQDDLNETVQNMQTGFETQENSNIKGELVDSSPGEGLLEINEEITSLDDISVAHLHESQETQTLNIEKPKQKDKPLQPNNAFDGGLLSCGQKSNSLAKEQMKKLLIWSGDSTQDLVSFVCSRMIPTVEIFGRFSGLKHWQLTVNNILIVAAEVSTDSNILHALRLCNDIVTDLVLPYQINLSYMHDIANSLLCGSIDSGEVFMSLLSMFECAPSSPNAQRIVCQFLFRCLSADTETKAYTYLFDAIEKRRIPEDNVQLLKAPLSFLLQQELGENENFFQELLNEHSSDFSISSDFLKALDSSLHNLFIQERIQCSFVLLIVDLLQETFETDDDRDNAYDLMLTFGKVLQNESVGFLFIAAVAYLKAAISFIAENISVHGEQHTLLEDLNAVISGLLDTPIHKSVLQYFLKMLGKNSALSIVMKHCDSLSLEYRFVKDINWTNGYLSKSLEGNPLALDLPMEMLQEGEKYISTEQTTETFESSMVKLMDLTSKKPVTGQLLLYSLAIKEYYLPRYRGILNDIERSRSVKFLEYFLKHKHSFEEQTLMKCILGKLDFKCSIFMLGQESSFQQYILNSILISCFARSLSFCKENVGQPSSYLKTCLVKPCQLKNCFLPGFHDCANLMTVEEDKILLQGSSFAMCKCNRRLLYRMQESSLKCAVCGKEIPEDKKQIRSPFQTSHQVEATPGFNNKQNMLEKMTTGQISDVSLNILQLLVKGCLIGSVALGISLNSDLEELFPESVSEIDKSSELEHEIYQHWNTLRKLLNLDDHDVGMFLHAIIREGSKILFEENSVLVKASHRDKWEVKFEGMVSKLLENRINTVQHCILSCNSLYKLPGDSVEVIIREVNDLSSVSEHQINEELPVLFTVTTRPSKMDFQCQLWPHRETYPLLTMFLNSESNLLLPKHIYQILQWHIATVVNTSYSFKRFDCLQKTVREFHDSLTDCNKRKQSKKIFEKFKKSWSTVRTALENSQHFETLEPVNYNTKMSECLILDTNCDLYKVLAFLIKTQNDCIDMALQLSFTCRNLQFLLRDNDTACHKVVPVTELRKENLIDARFDWEDTLAQESNSGLGYGHGKQVHYDFCNIEKELAVDLFVRKAYIDLTTLPKIIFADELYRNFVNLVTDVRHSVPQESLPSDLEKAFSKTNKEMANMSLELINHLDMILILLKNSKCDSDKSLADFVKERSNVLGLKFPVQYLPSPEDRLKVCHIVCLHELLEELSVDRVIGGFDDAYNVELDASIEDHFTKMPVQSVRKSEYVLKAMKRFIYRCILMGETDPEQPLLQFLKQESFWPVPICKDGMLQVDGKREAVKDIILPNILVCNVVSVVSHLQESVETQKQGELRMDRVITSWKSKGETSTKITRQKKAVKKLRKT